MPASRVLAMSTICRNRRAARRTFGEVTGAGGVAVVDVLR